MIKILLADDHALVRTGIRLLLNSDNNLKIVAEASDGVAVISLVDEITVDLIIMDISMDKMNGLECIRIVKEKYSHIKILVLSMHEEQPYIKKAMDAGASGYIPKASADTALFDAIYTVMKGEFYISKRIEQILLSSLFSNDKVPLEKLSPREEEVFHYLVHGHTITEIGEILNVSVKTIDTHKTKIYEKLGCQKRSELVKIAIQYNLLKTE